MGEIQTSYLVGRADRVLRSELDEQLREHRLTLNEVTTLSVLTDQPGMSNARLARRALVSAQAMHKVLSSLERAGFVERTSTPEGGRALATTITPDGARALATATTLVDRAEQRFLAPLDASERDELHRLLTKLTHLHPTRVST